MAKKGEAKAAEGEAEFQADKSYRVTLIKPIKVGGTWVRPGVQTLSGAVAAANREAIIAHKQRKA